MSQTTEAITAIVTDAHSVPLVKNPDQELLGGIYYHVKVTAIVALDSGVNLDEPCKITVPDLEEGSQVAGSNLGRFSHSRQSSLR